jgi:hypothetical protein
MSDVGGGTPIVSAKGTNGQWHRAHPAVLIARHHTSEHQGGTTMKTNVIGYWEATAILVFAVLTGGVGELAHAWGTL